MDAWGLLTLAIGAVIIGSIIGIFDLEHYAPAAIAASIGAFLGGFAASVSLGPASAWGTVWHGVIALPALIGAMVFAVIALAMMHAIVSIASANSGHPAARVMIPIPSGDDHDRRA